MSQSKQRMFIIGAGGFLGGYAVRVMSANFDIVRGGRANSHAYDVEIDVRNPSSVRTAFQAASPDVVLLLAALSDIDRCEAFPDEAWAVNVHGTEEVTNACARTGTRLMFLSSSAVFDGCKHGYAEDTSTNPVSVYGTTKAGAENLVMSLGVLAIVIRVALVIGFAGKSGTNSMLDGFAKRWAKGESTPLPVYEKRNPIDAETCSRFMAELLEQPNIHGIFHIGSSDSISRYELGIRLATYMGYSGLVRPLREPIPGRAPRGPDHFLLTDKLRAHCTNPIPTCNQVIARCFGGSTKSQV